MASNQQRVDFAFVSITREKREVKIEKEFSTLNQRLERKQSRPIKENFKPLVGRPRQTETVLLKPKVEKMKRTVGTKKVRGSYTNRFTLILWPLIFNAMKQHRSIGGVWNFLRSAYRKFGEISCVYDNLSQSSMREWFHPNGNLKNTCKHCVEFGTYFVKSTQHCSILDSHVLLKEEICTILKKMRKGGQPLYTVCIHSLINAIILNKVPHIFEGTHSIAFKVSYEWTKHFVKAKLN